MTDLLHRNLLSALDFPTASGTSTTSSKHTQGKALQHRWSFLWQLSSASFLVLIVAEKITQSIQDVHIISIHFSHSVVSNSLRPHGLQHARPPCPYQLPEFTQTHAHWVSNAIQPSHSLLSPSPPTFNLSQHQGFFPMSQFFTSGGQGIVYHSIHRSKWQLLYTTIK